MVAEVLKILWLAELVEGNDCPKKAHGEWAFPCEFERANISKTTALMLCMTKPIHGKGKVVAMDSGFCVAAGIIKMHKREVFGQALIKKRGRYWPKYVPGDEIDNYFAGKELGETMSYEQEVDGIKFLVHYTRDDRYVTKMMSLHGIWMKSRITPLVTRWASSGRVSNIQSLFLITTAQNTGLMTITTAGMIQLA